MKAPFLQLLILLGLASISAIAVFFITGNNSSSSKGIVCNPSQISRDEICLHNISENTVIIDARSRAAWEKAKFRNAILWNLDLNEDQNQFEASAMPHLINTESVVIYCESQNCNTSKEIAKKVRALDLPISVKTLYGGWDAIQATNTTTSAP